MYKTCKIQQSADRQWQIALTMIELMREQPYHNITVASLCRACQMPRKAFYRYFDTIDDVFQLTIDHMFLEYAEFRGFTSTNRIGSPLWNMEKFFVFWKRKTNWLDALTRNEMIGIMVSRVILNSQNSSLDIHMEQTDLAGENEMMVSAYVLSGLFAMVQIWYLGGFQQSVEEMAQLAVKLLTRPLYRG